MIDLRAADSRPRGCVFYIPQREENLVNWGRVLALSTRLLKVPMPRKLRKSIVESPNFGAVGGPKLV
jgi:hypothetical protein